MTSACQPSGLLPHEQSVVGDRFHFMVRLVPRPVQRLPAARRLQAVRRQRHGEFRPQQLLGLEQVQQLAEPVTQQQVVLSARDRDPPLLDSADGLRVRHQHGKQAPRRLGEQRLAIRSPDPQPQVRRMFEDFKHSYTPRCVRGSPRCARVSRPRTRLDRRSPGPVVCGVPRPRTRPDRGSPDPVCARVSRPRTASDRRSPGPSPERRPPVGRFGGVRRPSPQQPASRFAAPTKSSRTAPRLRPGNGGG